MAAYANRFGPHAAADVAASAGLVDDLGQRLTAPSSGGLAPREDGDLVRTTWAPTEEPSP